MYRFLSLKLLFLVILIAGYRNLLSNNAPFFNSTPITGAVNEMVYKYVISGTDEDGDSLFYFAEKLPGWLWLTDNKNDTAILQGIPYKIEDFYDTSVVICLTDGIDTVKQSFIIKIYCVYDMPTIVSSPETNATVGKEYLYDLYIADVDQDNHNISCSGFPTSFSFEQINSQHGRLTGMPSDEDIGTYEIHSICDYEQELPCHDPAFQIYDLTISAALGIDNHSEDGVSLKIINKQLFVTGNAVNTGFNGNIQLFDITGRLIINSPVLDMYNTSIDISFLGAGMYYARVNNRILSFQILK